MGSTRLLQAMDVPSREIEPWRVRSLLTLGEHKSVAGLGLGPLDRSSNPMRHRRDVYARVAPQGSLMMDDEVVLEYNTTILHEALHA